MINHESSVVICRPVQQVFAFLSEPHNDLQWQDGLLDSRQTSPGPVGVGTRVAEVYSFLGRRMEGQLEITEYEPNSRLTKKMAEGPFPLQITLVLEPAGADTKLTARIEMKPAGFFAIAEPMVAGNFRKRFDGDVAALKRVLEKS
jgi:uncharacterized protein YndB with AHSA1/START domain